MAEPCPTGCGRTHRDGHLMCGPCWHEVPKHLQRDVLRTWRKWRRDFGDTDAFQEYLAAREAAITSVTEPGLKAEITPDCRSHDHPLIGTDSNPATPQTKD